MNDDNSPLAACLVAGVVVVVVRWWWWWWDGGGSGVSDGCWTKVKVSEFYTLSCLVNCIEANTNCDTHGTCHGASHCWLSPLADFCSTLIRVTELWHAYDNSSNQRNRWAFSRITPVLDMTSFGLRSGIRLRTSRIETQELDSRAMWTNTESLVTDGVSQQKKEKIGK